MTDDHCNTHCPTDQTRGVLEDIQHAVSERLADWKHLLETNPALSSTEATEGVFILFYFIYKSGFILLRQYL